MKKLLFLILVFIMNYSLTAQQLENIEASSATTKKRASQSERQAQIKENWLQAKGRKKSNQSKLRKQADMKYEQLGYMAATDKYKMLDASEATDREVMIRMANSYRMNGLTLDAEYWYANVANFAEEPKVLLQYARVLQSNGKCEDAIRWYEVYKEKADIKGADSDFIDDCDYELAFTVNEGIQIENLKSINTKHLDFCAIPYADGLMFTSTRGANRAVVKKDSWSNDNFTDLYYAKLNDSGNIENIKLIEGDINGQHHDGVVTFGQGQSVMFFTRNSKEGQSKEGMIGLKLYMAYNHDSYWSETKELVFNSEEYASAHPTLSSDGNRLYFSSDRPGGFGGMDIYVSIFNGSGWNEPINLGPTVNSSGQEIFPFIASDDVLYYSSNGHRGMGGSDIFMAKKSDKENEESWNVRNNLGIPFNSNKDDFGFYVNRDNDKGFLSSNRDGGKGGDDIYSWSGLLDTKKDIIDRLICVYDQVTQEKIPNATVVLFERDNSMNNDTGLATQMNGLTEAKQAELMDQMNREEEIQSYKTNEKGEFLFMAKKGVTYSMRIEKEQYELKELVVDAKDLVHDKEYCVDITKRKCQELTVLVKNSEYDNPIPGAKVQILNKCTGEEQEVTTRKNGTVELCMECGCAFILKGSKKMFTTSQKEVSAEPGNCGSASGVDAVLLLTLIPPEEQGQETAKTQELKKHFLGNSNGQFYEGQVIAIEGIYYNYDKWDIRSDAKPILDKVIELMNTYPNMEIEMMSHTDSRGRWAYNNSLSMKRSKSVMDFIVNRGISKNRLSSGGYGETQLLNHCRDGMECSEKDHQLNRRTEIKIIKL